MSPNGEYFVNETQITGKTPKIVPQQYAWAKNGFGTNVPSKVLKLNELQMEFAKKIALNIKADPYYGFTEEQIQKRKVSLKNMLKNLSTVV
jgi:hypothetical protein